MENGKWKIKGRFAPIDNAACFRSIKLIINRVRVIPLIGGMSPQATKGLPSGYGARP